MKADRELDARIAEKVFEQKVVYVGGHPHLTEGNDNYLGGDCPHFSTQIADAWLVVEKLGEDGWSCNIVRHEKDDNLCEFWGGKMGNKHWREIVNHQPTTPLAICLAALAVVERRG